MMYIAIVVNFISFIIIIIDIIVIVMFIIIIIIALYILVVKNSNSGSNRETSFIGYYVVKNRHKKM